MTQQRSLRLLVAAVVLLGVLGGAASRAEEEVVELIPADRAGWSPTNLFAPITGLFLGGPGYWYDERRVRIETTPPGAALDLFYVRANFQKGYEQAEAPVTVVLPSRAEAGKRDSLTVRALLGGYRETKITIPVRSRQEEILITLEPLPNSLVALTHTYFAGRASLGFLTDEALTFRLSKDSQGRTYTVVLTETGLGPEAGKTFEGVESTLVESVRPQQLGEDLVVRFDLTEQARAADVELRSRQGYDPVRGLHSFSVDLVPSDGASPVRRARAALARVTRADVTGCALVYEEVLRDQLDRAALTRALSPQGAFTDPYLRASMQRLGELAPDGGVRLEDGTRYLVAAPIELSAATTQAADVEGYLALLRALVAELEPPAHRRETLRGLVAPEVPGERFDTIVESARAREARCRGGSDAAADAAL